MAHPIMPLQQKTCGSDLNDRVARICLPRGGYHQSNHSRSKRSIVKECCWNVCPDTNIYYYCSNHDILDDSSDNLAISTTTVRYMEQYQHRNDEVDDTSSKESVKSSNSNFFKSRQYGTISPEFRKEAIYVMGWMAGQCCIVIETTIKSTKYTWCGLVKWLYGTSAFNYNLCKLILWLNEGWICNWIRCYNVQVDQVAMHKTKWVMSI